jgi:hypothetical protein
MATINSHESDLYLTFYTTLYTDIVSSLNVSHKESRRDLIEIRSRYSREGLSFLTKTLPSLGKAIDKALHSDSPIACPTTFRRSKGQTTPELFRTLFQRVFQPTGYVAPEADIKCIEALRQLVYFLYKLEIPWKKAQEVELLEDFVRVDAGLVTDWNPSEPILKTAQRIVDGIFCTFDIAEIRPKHGPGAVSTGEKMHEKHVFKRLYSAIEEVYPFGEYFNFSLMSVADEYHQWEKLEPKESGTAKVVLVPKDSRGPRIISCEPLEYQWIQQGLGGAIMRHLEKHRITAGQINFSDQSRNQVLALQGSIDQQMVTLDMKEASDRVSLRLVEELFQNQPRLLAALKACRSTCTVLPNGSLVRMNKYAPMGSSLCFPVEAICFYVLGVASILHSAEFRASFPETGTRGPSFARGFSAARGLVYVYGDDIIVDRKFYPDLLSVYPSVGLKLNEDKCCIHGFFRESCGVDAYKGANVTPLRMKRRWSHRTIDANTLASYTEFSNLAYARGFKQVALLAASLVESKIGPLPVVRPEVAKTLPVVKDWERLIRSDREIKPSFLALIRPVSVNHIPTGTPKSFNTDYQCFQRKLWAIRPVQVRTDADSWCMVLRTMSIKEHFDALEVERKFYRNRSLDLRLDMSSPKGHTTPGIYPVSRRSRLLREWSELN